MYLVDAESRTHRGLDNQRTNVLPVLLQQRDKEVRSQHDVLDNLVLLHLNVTNRNSQTKNLLQLETDGGLNIVDLGDKILVVRDGGRELTSLRETRTEQTGDLLDKSLGSNESVVLLGKLLDELLVLVELLQVLNRHGVDTSTLSTITVNGITENTDGHVGTGNSGQLDSTTETLITLGVVVLQTNLELDGLKEVTLLLIRVSKDLTDLLTYAGGGNLRGHLRLYLPS